MNQDELRVKSYTNPKHKKKEPQNREIYTRNMFHASVLLQAGASFKYFKKHKKYFYMYLDTTFLDKKALANQFESLANDLQERKSFKDILENSVLSQIEHSYYRARNKLNEEIQNDRRGSSNEFSDDYDDDYDDDDSYDDSID